MDTTVVKPSAENKRWGGGTEPLKTSYGKMMMWFFITSDALTFAGFLAAYGFSRFKFADSWPIADNVFTHVPFIHGNYPMIFVAFMTFILIMSSVTMVLAVDAGHHKNKAKVTLYMFLTILGGLIFVGSQAYEWSTFIKGTYGAVATNGGNILHVMDGNGNQVALKDFAISQGSDREQHISRSGLWFTSETALPSYTFEEVLAGFKANPELVVRTTYTGEDGHKTMLSRSESLRELETKGKTIVEGANLKHNEYGPPLFANYFFFITGFHGFHVSIGIMLNIIIFFNVLIGTYERRGSYEMVEKVGLYWHFVDLVWVFVFTFFYLV
ncbi:cytochrome c oxidase subunit 3 [Gelidibacter salicanalis]|uniref:Cytochrome c oxidase subunit 3 n=1 Tax=Gelidibacter salicanalis TaxID=291193 RepID=A0A934KZA7_9FLAO|nr:cytochrome c oxidase subunit 3 [Gelidibacter salicanalis]MBJ7882220.1 cytochrome c oxidase subunit 3 [Gelidibacter salicanalis]